MGKNDRMRMTRAASTLPASLPRLLIALLLSAAGFSAFAQQPSEAASAAETPASAALPAPRQPLAKPVAPPLTAPPATWNGLTAAQQRLLAPLEHDWHTISPTQRSKWLSATPMLATLPPAELARLQERMRDWANMKPSERVSARVGFQVAKQVDAEQRQAKWEAYQALSPEKRQELNDKAVARRQAQTGTTRPAPKSMAAKPKSNIVPAAPKLLPPVPVTAGLVQARPGATTVLITRGATLPQHLSAGETKVVADPALVDPKTLLPRSPRTLPASAPPRS